MKIRTPLVLSATILAMLCAVSCEKPATVQKNETAIQPVDFQSSETTWGEEEFTPWMSRAELQMCQSNAPEDQYFAHVEGRDNHGRPEYRAVLKRFPEDQFDQWAVFWGIDEDELYDWELRLLKAGFFRSSMQAFRDAENKVNYQIVWLKKKGAVAIEQEVVDVPAAPQVADNDMVEVEQAAQPAPVAEPVEENVDGSASTPPPAAVPTVDAPKVEVTSQQAEPKAKPETPAPKATPVVEEETPKAKSYRVRPGDTLSKIARKHKTSVTAIKKKNGLRSDFLRVGQTLKLP